MSEKSAAQATSLVKAMRVLLALEESPQGRGVTEIARALELPKSAVHRVLVTFQEHGFVQQQSPGSRYNLGPTLARLGLRAAERCTPRQVARPHLEALAQEVGETVFLGVLVQDSVLVVDKVEHGQVLRISPALGTVLPLPQTALGKLLLAYCPPAQRDALLHSLETSSTPPRERCFGGLRQELEAIAQQGFAISLEEWTADVCCLAAPVRQSRGDVIAALALALPRSRMPQPQRHDPFVRHTPATQYPILLPALLSAAERISAALP